MKTNVTGIPALALALCLLLAACGGQGASPSEAPPEDLPPEETAPVPSGFPELEETADQLRLWHFGRQFAVSREDGAIRCLSDDGPVSYNEQMNIYTLFHYCVPGARLTGEWLPFRDLRHASPFAAAFQRGIVLPLARTFSGRGDLLPAAVERLRGVRISDSGFQLPAFACIPMRLNFWEGDEEFEAQANLLFDRSATDFIHVESVVTIASEGVRRLAEAAGLGMDRQSL